MNSYLENLKPQAVFHHFEAICRIPHSSYDTKRISDYCADYGRQKGLDVFQDNTNNVIIVKPASPGYENVKPVILQGHLDMVAEKLPESNHDFQNDPLSLIIDGDWLTADKTTLGGDDGIAVAYCLALLDDDTLSHPKLYLVLTTEEEVGMDGAHALDLTPIKDAASMINLDSEDEGILLAGCAGGVTTRCTWPIIRRKAYGLECTITLSNLHGGHSGQEINRFGANAHVLLATVLNKLAREMHIHLVHMEGGQKDNVIPKRASATVLIGTTEFDRLTEMLAELTAFFRKTYAFNDPELLFSAASLGEKECIVFDEPSFKRLIFILTQIPNGVQSMSQNISGLVETSLNMGILNVSENTLDLGFQIRSSVKNAQEALAEKMAAFAAYTGGECTFSAPYPAWEYRENSPLRDTMCHVFEKLYGRSPKVEAIHAGLECGLISEKLPELDIVSIGPDMKDIHTPDEKLSISSVSRTWDYLLAVLQELK